MDVKAAVALGERWDNSESYRLAVPAEVKSGELRGNMDLL
jgi:hypothetical protein